MKILVLNANYDQYALGWSYKRAFESLGHDVQMMDPMERLKRSYFWNNRLSRRLFERSLISDFNRRWLPELIDTHADVIWVGKGAWTLPQFWRDLKKAKPKAKLVCFNGDDPLVTYSRGGNRPWVTESIDCFDLFCTYKSALVEPLKRAGARRVACVPFAWDPHVHPRHSYGNFQYDLLFVGNGDAHRAKWLDQILSDPLAKDWKVAVFGAWSKERCKSFSNLVHHQQVVGGDMAQLVASSRISLNILRLQNEGSHNMRTFETPGCGGLLASQYSCEQAEFLNEDDKPGAIFFRDPADAVKQISFALKDDQHCRDLVAVSQNQICKHTYTQRAAQTLAALETI